MRLEGERAGRKIEEPGYPNYFHQPPDPGPGDLGDSFQSVAVVTHGGPIRFIFREVLGRGEIRLADGAFATLDHNNDLELMSTEGIDISGTS